jgi:hypothetical protein
MKLTGVIKSGFIAFAPVAIVLMLWIYYRAGNLVALSAGMEPGLLVPQTAEDAVRIGIAIWLPLAFILSILASLVYYFVATKWHWRGCGSLPYSLSGLQS